MAMIMGSAGGTRAGTSHLGDFGRNQNPRASEDQVFESHGVKVIIDPKSLVYLDGTELDFVKEGLNEGFKFTNPNVRGECGCGESFNI
jgi:iron-sulfur cluster assembly accessory protein